MEVRQSEIQASVRRHEIDMREQNIQTQKFDVSKHVRMVPPFHEAEVDKYFQHFEKVAKNLEWPERMWPMLLQSVLRGKAQEAYSALPLADSFDYTKVKASILKAYELVPEAYRQKFRNYKKQDNQTYVEFAHEKEVYFDRWCNSTQIGTDFEKLRQNVLIEEFKRGVYSDIKTYLDEKKVANLHEAAVMADDYALTHKSTLYKARNTTNTQLRSSPAAKQSTTNQDSARRSTNSATSHSNTSIKSPGPICHYCKKRGHVMSDCWTLKRRNQQETSPSAFVTALKPHFTDSPNDDITQVSENHKDFNVREEFRPFISKGTVSLDNVSDTSSPVPITLLRDTGAAQSLILASVLPFDSSSATGEEVIASGIENGIVHIPLHKISLCSDIVSGPVVVGVREVLPIKGVSLLLGNDLAGEQVLPLPKVVSEPVTLSENDLCSEEIPGVFPSCAVTRALAKKMAEKQNINVDSGDDIIDLSQTFIDSNENLCTNQTPDDSSLDSNKVSEKSEEISGDVPVSRNKLITAQEGDPEISSLFGYVLPEDELDKVPKGYFIKHGVLMRKWRPANVPATEDWSVVYQIVLPKSYRSEVLNLAHEVPMGGHLGINKTCEKVMKHFYWPRIRKEVSEFCKTCHTCQMVGKPNQKIPVAPLRPIPAFEEAFSRVIVDCVGPLPKTSAGNQYLLTIMCASTRFPEAIPLRSITAPKITKALVNFFTFVGLPREVQSDQGSNFMSGLFQQVIYQIGAKQIKSSAYHPESQGALERFHSTLKNMIRSYCFENEKDWDEGINLLLFAARESVQESLGFSPFELVFGHNVRGPLKLLKERWLQIDPPEINLLDYVSKFRTRLMAACKLAHDNLKSAQVKMKRLHDRTARERSFKTGDKVLVLLPTTGQPLKARYHGPYDVVQKVSSVDYVVKTPDRRKPTQLCHINMLKAYHDRNEVDQILAMDTKLKEPLENHEEDQDYTNTGIDYQAKLNNSAILANLDTKLSHLPIDELNTLADLLLQYKCIFPDVPSKTNVAIHDVDVGEAFPVKQHPYRVNPHKSDVMRQEISYMLDNGIIEPSNSNWASPCVLVPKPDGSYRFCTDFRKVNTVTKTDSYPIPRMDDCIDKIGKAKYITKCDLLKGYWCVPLSERAKEISAFVTPDGLYQYNVMPFGMKNSQATFQRMMNHLLQDLAGVETYVDDIVVYSDTWEEHLSRLRHMFERLKTANLTVNLSKSEFGQAKVTYLGHVVGHGQVAPISAKIKTIVEFPVPINKRSLMRFLGMAGYYRKFCRNFSTIAAPLTDLLSKNKKYQWSSICQDAFERVKLLLCTNPILQAPDFNKQFKLAVDASDYAAGAVLLQDDDQGVEHPVGYFSKKFNCHQRNYSTVEKETLALVLALQHFDVYVSSACQPVFVYTDHNPLTFLNKMKNKNRRLLNWSLMLQEYSLDIKHIRGVDNVCADALSRIV